MKHLSIIIVLLLGLTTFAQDQKKPERLINRDQRPGLTQIEDLRRQLASLQDEVKELKAELRRQQEWTKLLLENPELAQRAYANVLAKNEAESQKKRQAEQDWHRRRAESAAAVAAENRRLEQQRNEGWARWTDERALRLQREQVELQKQQIREQKRLRDSIEHPPYSP